MPMQPLPPRSPSTFQFVAATLAAVVAIGSFAGVTAVFQRDGMPMQRLVVAERACVDRAYVSEREACVRDRLTATPVLSAGTK